MITGRRTSHRLNRSGIFLLSIGSLATLSIVAATPSHEPSGQLASALLAPCPHPALGERMRLYGQFIGAWDVDVTVFNTDEARTRAHGEWNFGWVLEGRAVQDVWNVPPRRERDPSSLAAGPYGTTIRFPEPEGNAWRIVWLNPVRNDVTVMRANQVGTEIVQDVLGAEGDGTRWVFFDITPDRFRWRAEERHGDGWRKLQEMVVTRKRTDAPL